MGTFFNLLTLVEGIDPVCIPDTLQPMCNNDTSEFESLLVLKNSFLDQFLCVLVQGSSSLIQN